MKNYNIFISYSSKDTEYATKVVSYLESYSLNCFVAYRDIPKGVVWAKAIVNALEECEIMVVLFSGNFNLSIQVDREIEIASEEKKAILVFKITNDKFEGAKKLILPSNHQIEASYDFDSGLRLLANNIAKLLGIELNRTKRKIKFFSDVCCDIYINDKYEFKLKENVIEIIELPIGEYKIEAFSILHRSACYRKMIVNTTHSVVLIQLKEKEQLLTYLSGINLQESVNQKSNYGFINAKTKEVVIPHKYTFVSSFLDRDIIVVSLDNETYGCINRAEEIFVPFDNRALYLLDSGYIIASNNDESKYGLLDKCGKSLFPPNYDYIVDSENETFMVRLNGKYGIINKYGNEIIHCIYDYELYFNDKGLAIASKKHKFGIINNTGNEIVAYDYDQMVDLHGLIAVKLQNKWGCINWKGEVSIPILYEEIRRIGNYYRVMFDLKYGIRMYNDKQILPCIYDKIYVLNDSDKLSGNELFNVCLDGKWGFINANGDWIRNGIAIMTEMSLSIENMKDSEL